MHDIERACKQNAAHETRQESRNHDQATAEDEVLFVSVTQNFNLAGGSKSACAGGLRFYVLAFLFKVASPGGKKLTSVAACVNLMSHSNPFRHSCKVIVEGAS